MAAPIEPDPITHKKLVLVKQLYQHAIAQYYARHSTLSRILCVVVFDLAVETTLKAVVNALDTSRVPSTTFRGLVQQADDLLTEADYDPVPDKANIDFVHKIRNDAQHKAKHPTETQVSDCRTYVRDFLQKIIKQLWGISLEDISLTDLIQYAQVKDFLAKAEIFLSEGNYLEAVQNAAAGLAWALSRVRTPFVGRAFRQRAFLIEGISGEPEFDTNTSEALERMQDTLLYTALGMDFADFMRLRAITGVVGFTLKGNPVFQGTKVNPDARDAEFVVAYCTETVIRIEERVGDIDSPFGRPW